MYKRQVLEHKRPPTLDVLADLRDRCHELGGVRLEFRGDLDRACDAAEAWARDAARVLKDPHAAGAPRSIHSKELGRARLIVCPSDYRTARVIAHTSTTKPARRTVAFAAALVGVPFRLTTTSAGSAPLSSAATRVAQPSLVIWVKWR